MDWLKTVDEIDDIVHEGRSSGVGKSYVEAEIYAAAVEQLRAEARDLIEFERTQREPVVTGLVDELARIGAEGRSVPFTGRRRIDGDAADEVIGSLREDLVKVELQRRRAVVEARTHRIDLTGGPEQPSLAALVDRVSLRGERLLVRYGTVVAEMRTPDSSPEGAWRPGE